MHQKKRHGHEPNKQWAHKSARNNLSASTHTIVAWKFDWRIKQASRITLSLPWKCLPTLYCFLFCLFTTSSCMCANYSVLCSIQRHQSLPLSFPHQYLCTLFLCFLHCHTPPKICKTLRPTLPQPPHRWNEYQKKCLPRKQRQMTNDHCHPACTSCTGKQSLANNFIS